MKNDREPLEHEQALLAHFRAHGGGEPSAEIDARIMAAASAAANVSARTAAERSPSWGQRLQVWLFGGGRQRWSVAVAGLACIGIGASLTWRTLDQTPDAFDAVPQAPMMAPAAPMAAAKSAPEREALARQYAAPAASAPSERRKETQALRMQSAPVAAMADMAAEESMALTELVAKAEPRESLLRLLELRREGKQEEAGLLLEQLRVDYPQLDIEAELNRLESGAEQ